MFTFKLSNVYITNLVKCGLNNDEGGFKGIKSFHEDTIKQCYSRFLEKEISIVKPRIVFTMGSAVDDWVKFFVQDAYYVQHLPHPAGRSVRHEHLKAIYFWGIAHALHKAGIIGTEEGIELARIFSDCYDTNNRALEISVVEPLKPETQPNACSARDLTDIPGQRFDKIKRRPDFFQPDRPQHRRKVTRCQAIELIREPLLHASIDWCVGNAKLAHAILKQRERLLSA